MAKLLVDMAERQWIADHAVKEIGTQVKFKVMDIDIVVPRIQAQRKEQHLSPYIMIQPISVDMHKVPNRMPTFQKDPVTNVLYGLLIGVDQFGNPRWQRPVLQDGMYLDMSLVNDVKLWSVLRFNPHIEGSPFQIDSPIFKIYDPTSEAKGEINRNIAMKEAFGHIDTIMDKPRELINFVRFLGEEVHASSSFEIVYGLALKSATRDPHTFNRKWKNPKRGYAEKYYAGIALGLITNDPEHGIVYKRMSLGFTDEDVIQKLSEDAAIMKMLVSELVDIDSAVRNLETELASGTKESKNNLE